MCPKRGLLTLAFALAMALAAATHAVADPIEPTALPLGDFIAGDATFVNNSGRIAGTVTPDYRAYRGATWTNGNLVLLDTPGDGVLDDCNNFWIKGINAAGQIIGTASDATWTFSRSFIWTDGVMTEIPRRRSTIRPR